MYRRLFSIVLTSFGLLYIFPLLSQTANFSASPTTGCSPIIVTFTNLSTGASSYTWSFGDGNTSPKESPTESYVTPGTYTVKLTINGTITKTETNLITVYGNPTAKFIGVDSTGCAPLTVKFEDKSKQAAVNGGAITDWLWTFGDGSGSSIAENPVHTYNTAGTYTVHLYITDAHGCKSTDSAHIVVSPKSLNAGFSVSPTIGCSPPATVNVSNTSSSGSGITYSWSFGDGGTSTLQNPPAHTYTSSGNYVIKLTVKNSSGCTQIDSVVYSVLGASNVAFTANDTSGCPGTTVKFTDKTNPTPSTWKWEFGDGSTSNSQNPVYTYKVSGKYTVTLVVGYDAGRCSDSVVEKEYIDIHPTPVVNFTADSVNACATPFTVHFKDHTAGAASWKWTFGDGGTGDTQDTSHTYTLPGVYTVKLVVTSAFGCVDSATTKITIVLPMASFTTTPFPAQGCVPLSVSFTNTSKSPETITSWLWTFGDTASHSLDTSMLKNPIHVFNDTGKFTITLTLTNSYGCKSTITEIADVIVTDKPVIGFKASGFSFCALSPVVFTDTSKNATRWLWNFGDNQTGNGTPVTHLYSDTGLFTVTEIVYNIGCPDTLVKVDTVRIKPGVPIITVAPINCDSQLTRQFSNVKSIGADKFVWNFGDGSPNDSIDKIKSHTFPAAKTYTVTLTVTNTTSGCVVDTALQVTLIQLDPMFAATPSLQGCNPLTVFFKSTTTGGTPSHYLWLFGDGHTAAGATTDSTSHIYTTPGKYPVQLYVKDAYGCTDTSIADTIIVYDIAPGFEVVSQIGCDSLAVTFRDTSKTSPPANHWLWDFGDGETDTLQNPVHYYTKTGTYSVTLNVGNTAGTCSVTEQNKIVFTLPVALFTTNNDTLTCPHSTINFINKSMNANKYSWNFGDGSPLSKTQNPSHAYAKNGVYTVTLVAIDSIKGCTDTLTEKKFIYIDNPIAGFKHTTATAICPPLSVTFVDTSTAFSKITSHVWIFGDGNVSSPLTNDTSSNTYTSPGKFTVTEIVTDATGCTDTILKVDSIIVNGPTGTLSYDPLNGCVPVDVNFKLKTFNTKYDTLTFGDGTLTSKDTCCISHVYSNANPSIQPILILIDSEGCRYTPPLGPIIAVYPYPMANFSYSPLYPKAGETVQFTDESLAATSWSWVFGDTTSGSTSQNPTHVFKSSGIYVVTDTVDNHGCRQVVSKEITVIGNIIVPNIFSPNGDGINDTFDVGQYGYTEINIHIYDRWGLLIFNKDAERIYWDGFTTGGLQAPAGTYYYTVSATALGGSITVFKGFVQLAR